MITESELGQKKEALKQAYPNSSRWHRKVDNMKEAQVVAIYLKFQASGKLR